MTIGGHDYVAIYSRVQVSNPTAQPLSIDPAPSAGLIPLNSAPTTVPPHGTVNHDYVEFRPAFTNRTMPPGDLYRIC